MLIETMTLDEIAREMQKDRQCLRIKEEQVALKDIKQPFFKNIKTFPYYYLRTIESNRRNKYFVRIELQTRRSVTHREHFSFAKFAVFMKPGKGHYVYILDEGNLNIVNEYQPHFFHRYAERCGVEGDAEEVIKHYLKNNTYGLSSSAEFEGKKYMIEAFKEGIGLGEIVENGHVRHKTFVSYDILTKNKKEFQSYLVELKEVQTQLKYNRTPEIYERACELSKECYGKADEILKRLWKDFGRYHLEKEVDVKQISTGKYELTEREETEEKKMERQGKHNKYYLPNEDLMTPEERRIVRLELLIRKFRKYDQERKEYYAAVLKENEELKARVVELEALLENSQTGNG